MTTNNKPEFDKFFADKAERLRYEYSDIGKNSIVLDVGGFEGNFSKKINSMYGCDVFVFEPVVKFFNAIRENTRNHRIFCFNYGLYNSKCKRKITLSGDGTSTNIEGTDYEICNFLDVLNVLDVFGNVDLLKLNIEGDEFDVLERLISDKDKLKTVKNIQVQFHNFIPNCYDRYELIVNSLKDTHDKSWGYYFVWENWKLKN